MAVDTEIDGQAPREEPPSMLMWAELKGRALKERRALKYTELFIWEKKSKQKIREPYIHHSG